MKTIEHSAAKIVAEKLGIPHEDLGGDSIRIDEKDHIRLLEGIIDHLDWRHRGHMVDDQAEYTK